MQDAADKAVLIAGPTASGKSALALALARAYGGVVINADSMQVYRDLRILTARPSTEEEAEAPHRLYGHRDAAENFSVGAWLSDAAAVLAEARAKRWMPIFVGGTGLYFRTLTRGLSAIPPIPEDIREAVRAQLAREGSEAVHAELARLDPVGAERLAPRDRTRVSRALEVVRATGRPIAEWHAAAPPPLVPMAAAISVFLSPERQDLYHRIDERFEAMMVAGALDEVRALAARDLDPLLPAMKAHGVPWINRYLRGEITLAEAIAGGQADTRHYAKRQFTWFRHQLPDFEGVEPKAARELIESRIEGGEEISSGCATSEADTP